MSKAVYPGTFDPPTLGHQDIIRRAARLFDELVVCVMDNANKTKSFTAEERVDLLRRITADLPNVTVECSDELQVDFAQRIGANVLVRGLRSSNDFEYEFQMSMANHLLNPDMEMMYLLSNPDYLAFSSSGVKEIAQFRDDLSQLVPHEIVDLVEQRICKNKKVKV